MPVDVVLVLDQLSLEQACQAGAFFARLWQAFERRHHEMKPVELVEHRHVERRGRRAFLVVPVHVEVVMVGAIVLFVLLALYMPVFNLGKTVVGSGK